MAAVDTGSLAHAASKASSKSSSKKTDLPSVYTRGDKEFHPGDKVDVLFRVTDPSGRHPQEFWASGYVVLGGGSMSLNKHVANRLRSVAGAILVKGEGRSPIVFGLDNPIRKAAPGAFPFLCIYDSAIIPPSGPRDPSKSKRYIENNIGSVVLSGVEQAEREDLEIGVF